MLEEAEEYMGNNDYTQLFQKFNCESGERSSLVAGERHEVQDFSLRKS